jgi:hypothetical protein
LHVGNAIHNRIDLSFENISVGQLAFGAANLDLPAWIEEVYNASLVHVTSCTSRSYLHTEEFGPRDAE